MKKINYEDSFSAVVDFLTDEIAGMIDVNRRHVEIVSIEASGEEEFYENGDIAIVRKVVWRTRDWEEGEVVYGDEKASAWVSVESDDLTNHSDIVFFDYNKYMEEE